MKFRIGSAKTIFMFSLKIYDKEVDFLWNIEKGKKRWLWLCYANAQHDKRVWGKEKGQYHFSLQIPKIITIDTAHVGKKLIGRLNLTRLFKKDYHIYSSGDDCEMGLG